METLLSRGLMVTLGSRGKMESLGVTLLLGLGVDCARG